MLSVFKITSFLWLLFIAVVIGAESPINSANKQQVLSGEDAWHIYKQAINDRHGYSQALLENLVEADNESVLFKNCADIIDRDIAEYKTSALLGFEGSRYARSVARFMSHKPQVGEYLVKLAIADQKFRADFPRTDKENPVGRDLSSSILMGVGNNTKPGAYKTLNDLWEIIEKTDENKRIYYVSLCQRIRNNVNHQEAANNLE